tara:strand:+ start:158 stop:505 length:348 start_codon:yes stop_codon:yes gene_type:complete
MKQRKSLQITHHLQDHFQDKPIEDILQDIITNETISDEEKERTLRRILGEDGYHNFKRQQSLRIKPVELATHDKRGIGRNSPPASSGDVLAGPLYKRLMLGGGVKGSSPKNPYGL